MRAHRRWYVCWSFAGTRFCLAHPVVKLKVIKRWCVQILEGLVYLHSLKPPVIHRDIKCENMLYNSAVGTITIGDLGLATQASVDGHGVKPAAASGTPNFMAPEMFDGEYDETVDVYSFGLCVLEMVTRTIPYEECTNLGQIFMKLSSVRLACVSLSTTSATNLEP